MFRPARECQNSGHTTGVRQPAGVGQIAGMQEAPDLAVIGVGWSAAITLALGLLSTMHIVKTMMPSLMRNHQERDRG